MKLFSPEVSSMCTSNAQTLSIYNAEKRLWNVVTIFSAHCTQGFAMMYLIAISQYGQHNLKFKKYFLPDTPSQLNVQITGFRGAEKNDSNQGICLPVCQDAEWCRHLQRCLT
jgi:hypothetical protein